MTIKILVNFRKKKHFGKYVPFRPNSASKITKNLKIRPWFFNNDFVSCLFSKFQFLDFLRVPPGLGGPPPSLSSQIILGHGMSACRPRATEEKFRGQEWAQNHLFTSNFALMIQKGWNPEITYQKGSGVIPQSTGTCHKKLPLRLRALTYI